MNMNQVTTRLVRRALDTILAEYNYPRLRTLFRDGFRGYNNMTAAQRAESLKLCGTSDFPWTVRVPDDSTSGTGAAKKSLVSRLVQRALDTALADPRREWLQRLLHNGFKGYGNMTETQLVKEMQLCGMLDFPEPESDVDDVDYEVAETENELALMLGGMARAGEGTPGYE
jgi:hypothetical protein